MVYSVKEFLQIYVNDPPKSLLYVGLCLFNRIVGSFPRSEAEAI